MIDERIIDLALKLQEDPGARLTTAYRCLEDIVRKLTGSMGYGTKLFAEAFNGDQPLLTWPDTERSERQGRAQLFTSVYMAYRNPRAHRESVKSRPLSEFLLVNQLFGLEAEAVLAHEPSEASG